MQVSTFLTTVGLVFSLGTAASAQERLTIPCDACKNEVVAYVGVARHSTMGQHLGTTTGRNHLLLGLHFDVPVLQRGPYTLGYAPEILLLRISNNPAFVTFGLIDGSDVDVAYGTPAVHGFGLSPIGVEGNVRLVTRLRAYGAAAMGGVWFTRDVPVPFSTSFNYTFEWGAGIEWEVRPGQPLRIGYKFHHLSNNGRSPINPGLDGNVWMIGWGRMF